MKKKLNKIFGKTCHQLNKKVIIEGRDAYQKRGKISKFITKIVPERKKAKYFHYFQN